MEIAGGRSRRGLASFRFLVRMMLGSCLAGWAWMGCVGADLREEEGGAPSLDWEWDTYLGDAARTHFAPLDQIHRENVDQLEVAWVYDTGPPPNALSQIQCNPIVVDGTLFGTTSRGEVFALDAATGQERWKFDPADHGGISATHNRGVVHWSGPAGGRILASAGPHVFSIDARTGEPVASFGEAGRIDLRDGLVHAGAGGDVSAPTPGVVFRDLLIVGTKVGETAGSAPGDVRAYHLGTGALVWTFHTIPRPGELGSGTWPEGAWETAGGANAWAGVTLDEARGIVFVPTGSATPDFWGGSREGSNLFANSLVALDANTGERLWHFQFVHHDLWDRDLPAPPTLVRLRQGDRWVDAIAQTTKSGHVFVFDRQSGNPFFPIEERAVHGAFVDGQRPAPTQPFPTAPPPFTRQSLSVGRLDDRAPGFRKAQANRISSLRGGEPFLPPSLEGSLMYPGFDGGAEWGGAAWDAASGLLFVNANEVGGVLRLMERPKGVNPKSVYAEKCAVCHGSDLLADPPPGSIGPSLRGIGERRTAVEIYTAIALGGGRMPSFMDMPLPIMERLAAYLMNPANTAAALAKLDARPGSDARYVSAGYEYLRAEDGIPINEPPWGTLTAIDLAAGELRWQVPLGEYPALAAQGRVGTGTENYGGPVVTSGGLLFIAATADAKIRAFDKETGEELWQAPLPAAGFATPATYTAGGRQFLVVAAGGGKLGLESGSQYVAFALPPR